jgi:hypothetical protein
MANQLTENGVDIFELLSEGTTDFRFGLETEEGMVEIGVTGV